MKRPTRLDWLVYRIFRWWWNPILRDQDWMVGALERELRRWRVARHDFMRELK